MRNEPIMSTRMQKHHILRVNDGDNFRNSKYPCWGVPSGHGKNKPCLPGGPCRNKTYIMNHFKPGDILWFLTSVPNGGTFIGMAEYDYILDRRDEPLFNIETRSDEEQNWRDENKKGWIIEIYYKNLYIIEEQASKLNLTASITANGSIFSYDTLKKNKKHKLPPKDLSHYYKGFKRYGKPTTVPHMS